MITRGREFAFRYEYWDMRYEKNLSSKSSHLVNNQEIDNQISCADDQEADDHIQ